MTSKKKQKKSRITTVFYLGTILYTLFSIIITITKPPAHILFFGIILGWVVINFVFLIYILLQKKKMYHTLVPILFLIDFLISLNAPFFISRINIEILASPQYAVALLIIPIITMIISIKRLLK